MNGTTDLSFAHAEEAAAAVRAVVREIPTLAIVLGSGLGEMVDSLTDATRVPYSEIPHMPRPSVDGHAGNLVAGMLGDVPVLALQGRFHYYEGHEFDAVTFPIRLLQRLGVTTVILTAAAGGIGVGLRPGDLVCVSDHINLIGRNPLRGPNDSRLGPRFPDMTEVYSLRLRQIAGQVARDLRLNLHSGIYACLPGPSYETPAEIRMLRTLGADVVGMSTVPEAIVARHAGMQVLAIAVVSNLAAGIGPTPLSHADVLAAGKAIGTRMFALVRGSLERIIRPEADELGDTREIPTMAD